MRISYILKEIGGGGPAEFQVLPYGRIDIEGEDPAFINEEAMGLIIADFERRSNDMVIDYEHQTLKGVQAPAAGWIKKLISKGKEGLWAVVEWTEKAKEYLANKEYRYFSPVFWVAKAGRKVVRIENVALTNFPKVNNLRPIIAKMGEREEAREAQEERSRKYKIRVKDGGHVTKPSEWEGVPDDEWLDPVNYRYPCPDAAQTRAAASYWGQSDNQAQYNPEERSIINERLDRFREKFNIGEFKKEEAKMLTKLRKVFGLADDAGEDKVIASAEAVVAKNKELETKPVVVACKEVLEALGAKADATKEEIVQIVGSLKTPANVTANLSQEVSKLTLKLSHMEGDALIKEAVDEGKTNAGELEKFGRNLAYTNPEQFKNMMSVRAKGSMGPPVQKLPSQTSKADDPVVDEAVLTVGKMMGLTPDDIKKYGK